MLRHAGQIPLYHDHKPTGRPLDEYHRSDPTASQRKFAYRLLDCPGSPRWPFGYGLSYSDFTVEAGTITSTGLDAPITLSYTLRNTGQRRASTVVQVYFNDPVAELSQPVRRLAGWERIELEAGDEHQGQISIPLERLAYTHRDGERRTDPGRYRFWIGQHSSDGEAIEVEL